MCPLLLGRYCEWRCRAGPGAKLGYGSEPATNRARNACLHDRLELEGDIVSGRCNSNSENKLKGAPAWDREPRKARFVASVVFTPARGVIHPSFPLRGRLGTNCRK